MGKKPNNCFNLTQRSSVSQVKQMLGGRPSIIMAEKGE